MKELLTRLNGAADMMEADGFIATADAQRRDNEIVRELIEALENLVKDKHCNLGDACNCKWCKSTVVLSRARGETP